MVLIACGVWGCCFVRGMAFLAAFCGLLNLWVCVWKLVFCVFRCLLDGLSSCGVDAIHVCPVFLGLWMTLGCFWFVVLLFVVWVADACRFGGCDGCWSVGFAC